MKDKNLTIVKFLMNRLRCPHCNAGSEYMIGVITDSIRFRPIFRSPKSLPINNTKKGRSKISLNRLFYLDSSNCVSLICIKCGSNRVTTIPNI